MRTYLILLLFPMLLFSQQPTKEQIKKVATDKKEVRKMKGKPFPDFQLTTIDGNQVSSEDTKGKYVLFNFWFTRCRPCIEEMPELNELVAEYSDEDVLFLAPTFDDSLQVKKFLNRFEFDYQLISNEKAFCNELNVTSFPAHFVVNREGIVERVVIGYSQYTVGWLRKSLDKLLKSE